MPPGAWHPFPGELTAGSRRGPEGSGDRAWGGGIQPRRERPSRLLLERAECTSHNSLSLSLSAPLPPLARTRGDVFYLGKNLTTSNSCDFPVGETPLFAGADGHVWALGAPSEESDLRAALRCTGKGRQYQQQRDLFVRSLKITQREISLERRGGVYEKIFTFKKDFYFAVVCGFFFF